MANVRLVRDKAKVFLLLRAGELKLTWEEQPIKTGTNLARRGILRCSWENAHKYLEGIYPLTEVEASHLRAILKITDAEWERIAISEGDAMKEGVEVPSRVLPISSPPRGFLERLGVRGLASAVAFVPRTAALGDIAAFCVSARVITDEEWNSFSRERPGSVETALHDPCGRVGRRAIGVSFNTWLRRVSSRVVLKGEPGEGKTTALWLLVSELCQNGIKKLDAGETIERVPLLLSLSGIADTGRESPTLLERAVEQSLITANVKPVDVGVVREWLNGLVQSGKIMLILDALDELPASHTGWLRQQIGDLPNVPTVLTTRYHADPGLVMRDFAILRLVPLRFWLVEEFITRYFACLPQGTLRANELRSVLRQTPALRQLTQNPFLLTVICHLQADDECGSLPTTRAGLLHATLLSLMRRGDQGRGFHDARRLRDEQKVVVLSELAWRFQRDRPVAMEDAKLLAVLAGENGRITVQPPTHSQALLMELVEDGVLVRRGRHAFNFLLRLFHEHALALHLARQADSKPDFAPQLRGRAPAWGRKNDWGDFRPLNQPGWVEVWPLLAGSIGDNAVLVEVLEEEWRTNEDLVHGRLRLLALVLGEFLESNADNRGIQDRWRPLAEEVTEAVLDQCIDNSRPESVSEGWRILVAHFPTEMATAKVESRLFGVQVDETTAISYALTLGEIGNPKAIALLEYLIGVETLPDDVRASAAVALGLIGDTNASKVLLSWTKLSAPGRLNNWRLTSLHLGCISGLAHVADPASRNALAKMLSARGVREPALLQCVTECGRLFGPEIERELLKFTERRVKEISGRTTDAPPGEMISKCAHVLGRIGGRETAKGLLKLCNLPLGAPVLEVLCNAVAQTGDLEGREVLRRWATGSDGSVRPNHFAALALVGVGDEVFLEPLLAVAKDLRCGEHLRTAVIQAFIRSRSSAVPSFLAERLAKDPSVMVATHAAVGLGSFSDIFTRKALKETMKNGSSKASELECAMALAANGEPEASAPLLKALELYASTKGDFHNNTVKHVVQFLANLSTPVVHQTLRRMAEDPNGKAFVRQACLDALFVIQMQQGWRALVRGGWEAP